MSTSKKDTRANSFSDMAEERVPILKKQNSDSKSIYFAAALFASRECVFNIELSNSLEEKGFKVNLP